MKSSRILTAYLTLAALLFGNIAGWVHVGCSSSESCCCSDEALGCETGQASWLQDTLAYDTLEMRSTPRELGQDQCGHCCCHHDQRSQPLSDVQDGNDKFGSSSEQHKTRGHDADCCSICQGFYGSRNAVANAVVFAGAEKLRVCGNTLFVNDHVASGQIARSHSVRGPPRA